MNRFNAVNLGSGCGVPSTSSPKATDSCVCLGVSMLILAMGWDIRRLAGVSASTEKMETLRDAPFGQTCRLLSRWNLFLYPEERDPDFVQRCVTNLDEARGRDRAAREADPAIGSGENYTSFTLTAQVSHAKTITHPSSNIESTNRTVDLGKESTIAIVGWAGPDDSQVRIF